MPKWTTLIGLVATLQFAAPAAAQEGDSEGKHFQITRSDKAPVIDGQIGTDEWRQAARLNDLHQVRPSEFEAPSERTIWYVTHDDDALYIAAYAYDSDPDGIVAQKLRQGSQLWSDDTMTVLIDAFNNKRSGYSFTLNPNGVRAEAIYASATRPSNEWDGIWRGAATIVDDGWTMEMAIPFNTITFDPQNETWGINFTREIPRKAEGIAWQSRNGRVNPTVSGEVTGLSGLSQGLGLDVIPSASATYENDRELNDSGSEFNPSLDVNYKLTPSISGLLTINTDFAATEVDGRQLDLQRFSLFFPEKRSFFLTDFDIFQFGGVSTGRGGGGGGNVGMKSGRNGLAFFSRTIGLTSDGEQVDIIAGAKLSGRAGNVDFGTLYIRQDEYVNDDDELIDPSDLYVTRVSAGVLEESSVGAIFTHGDPGSNLDSSHYGADFLYRNTRIGSNRSMEGNFWVQRSDIEGIDDNDLAWSAHIGFPAQIGFAGGFQVQEVEENFAPAMGFANRTGVRLYGGEFGYRRVREGDVFIREISHEIEFARWEYLDTGNIQTQEFEIDYLGAESSSGDFLRLNVRFHKEGLLSGEQPLEDLGILIPAGEYSFERWGGGIFSASHRKWEAGFRFGTGGYFNGDLLSFEPYIGWTPNAKVSFSLQVGYDKYDFPGQTATTRQITLSNELAFNAKLSLVTLIQYDNLSEDIGLNSRLRYNLAAGQDIWFVINHNMLRDPQDDRFHSTQSVAAAKIRYTFRY